MNRIRTATGALLWSLWTELGLPGAERHHSHLLSDPEPLIVFTPFLAASDSRLLGLVFDWCAAHADHLSVTRIKALADTVPEDVRQSLMRFNGALEREGIRWSPTGSPGPFEVGRRRMALPLERPSLLRLRLRFLAGVSARAEVLTELLVAGRTRLSSEELAIPGITRRSTDRVIAELVKGGFLTVHGKQRGRRFSLINQNALSSLFGHGREIPLSAPMNWHALLQAVVLMHFLQGIDGLQESVRRVEAVRLRHSLAQNLKAIRQDPPPVVTGRMDAFLLLLDWCVALVSGWADGRPGLAGEHLRPG